MRAVIVAVALLAVGGSAFSFGNDLDLTPPLRAEQTVSQVLDIQKADEVAWASAVAQWHAELTWYQGILDAEAARLAARRGAWERLHICEQADSWTVDGTFGNGLRGGGGLGISNGAWDEAGGRQYAPIPGMATPDQQIAVAEVILARHGPGAWGCPLVL